MFLLGFNAIARSYRSDDMNYVYHLLPSNTVPPCQPLASIFLRRRFPVPLPSSFCTTYCKEFSLVKSVKYSPNGHNIWRSWHVHVIQSVEKYSYRRFIYSYTCCALYPSIAPSAHETSTGLEIQLFRLHTCRFLMWIWSSRCESPCPAEWIYRFVMLGSTCVLLRWYRGVSMFSDAVRS